MRVCASAAPAAQLVAFKCFGGIVNLDPIGARHALALAVVAARKVQHFTSRTMSDYDVIELDTVQQCHTVHSSNATQCPLS